ncbi:MAG: hypothetical protein LBU13_04290 [Synergistaceae bacterium]|nr:hypothetical protein [Synergistaceae bacterium]
MGYDVSFHPISKLEIQTWYFDMMKDDTKIDALASEYGIEGFYKEKYRDTVRIGQETANSENFDKTHSYYIATVQGFFRAFYYARGSAFSFLIEKKPEYRRYTEEWRSILGRDIANPVENIIIENYCGGVYIPAEQVIQLLSDYEEDAEIRHDIRDIFDAGFHKVFLKALGVPKELGTGLLEATEVIEPDPLNLNASLMLFKPLSLRYGRPAALCRHCHAADR